MNQNSLPRKKKELISKQVKYVIAAASVAGTMGLWGIFSKADVQTTTTQATDSALPTVATLVAVDTNSLAQIDSTANNSGNLSASAGSDSLSSLPVVTQAPSASISSGQASTFQQPVPLTSTRSSR